MGTEDKPPQSTKPDKYTDKFSGHTPALKGQVFDASGSSTKYTETRKHIKVYATLEYKDTPDILSVFEDPPALPSIP